MSHEAPKEEIAVGTGVAPLIIGAQGGSAAEQVRSLANAELDFLSIADHVSFRTGMGIDGLLNAASVLAWQSRIPVKVGVYLLALRHPTVVARQLADIERLHPGRLAFTVGVGGEDRGEFLACGVDPASRGKRTDEALDIVRALLTEPAVSYEGRHFVLDDVTIEPRPAQPVPLLIGGRSEHALRRTARVGDGWQALFVSASRFKAATAQVADMAESYGRADVQWKHGINIWCDVDLKPELARDRLAGALKQAYGGSFEQFERWAPFGTPQQVAEALYGYVEAGCTSFTVTLPGDSLERSIAGVEAIRGALHSMVH